MAIEQFTEQLYAGGKPICPNVSASAADAKDIHNLTGKDNTTVQMLLDAIADRVVNQLLKKTDIAEWAKQQNKPSYTASEIGADTSGSAVQALADAKTYADNTYMQATGYTDVVIAGLINGAPKTLDTLGEIANAMAENDDIVAALQSAIGSKASEVELQAHMSNSTVHITASERNTWNAAKTKLDGIADGADAVAFTQALKNGAKVGTITINGVGYDLYAPVNTDTTYGPVTTSADGLMTAVDKVKLNGIAAGANKTTYTNNLLATVPGTALDATQGKILDDKITSQNNYFANKLAWKKLGSGFQFFQLGTREFTAPEDLTEVWLTVGIPSGAVTMSCIYLIAPLTQVGFSHGQVSGNYFEGNAYFSGRKIYVSLSGISGWNTTDIVITHILYK